jgi:hypothetical protein
MTAIIFVFFAAAAALWFAGIWGNVLALVNIIISGSVATAFFNELSAQIVAANGSTQLIAPFLSFWLLFFVTMGVLRGATDAVSKYALKFNPIAEMIGRSCLCLINGALLASIVMFSLHASPISNMDFKNGKALVAYLDTVDTSQQNAALVGWRPEYGPERLWGQLAMYFSKNSLRGEALFDERLYYTEGGFRRTKVQRQETLLTGAKR